MLVLSGLAITAVALLQKSDGASTPEDQAKMDDAASAAYLTMGLVATYAVLLVIQGATWIHYVKHLADIYHEELGHHHHYTKVWLNLYS